MVSNGWMWKESVIYVQRLKAGMKIIKITKTNVIKWPLSIKYQEAGELVGATVAGKVQELHPEEK